MQNSATSIMASAATPRPTLTPSPTPTATPPFFKVPDYLVSRQEEWEREAERRRAEAPDPSCPPGMKLMPEEERLKTLGLLQVRQSS